VDWCVHEQDAVAGVADVASLVSGGTFLAKGSVARHTPAAHSTKNRSADRSCRQRRLVSAPLHFAWVKLLKSILDGVSCRHEDRRRRLVLMAILDRDQTKITESIARDGCGPRLAGQDGKLYLKRQRRNLRDLGGASAGFCRNPSGARAPLYLEKQSPSRRFTFQGLVLVRSCCRLWAFDTRRRWSEPSMRQETRGPFARVADSVMTCSRSLRSR
jgi:hypothetical protein